MPEPEQIVRLLYAHEQGDPSAFGRLVPLVYEQLRRLAQVFECRYFAGLGEEETAEVLGLSLRTVQRGWPRARTWLKAELQGAAASSQG